MPSRSLATQFVSPLYSIKTVGDKFGLLRFKQRPVCILRVIGDVCDSGYDLGWEPFSACAASRSMPPSCPLSSVLNLPAALPLPAYSLQPIAYSLPQHLPVALKKATPKSERMSAAGAGA